MSQEQKEKKAQKVFDSVLNAFPNLRDAMLDAQNCARKNGYVETILGRRRHIPDMTLPEFEFIPREGYINPDIDPLDPSTLHNRSAIPERIVKSLRDEFKQYKYFGQIAKRTKELYEKDNIKVINNRPKITEATRQCLNCVSTDTEILTTDGWKKYNELVEGQSILAYDMDTQAVVLDTINAINVHQGDFEVACFNTPTFYALSTFNHRWVVGQSNQPTQIKLTDNIYKNKWPDYPILRAADNTIESKCNYTDDELKLIGWILTDGHYGSPYYALEIYQSTKQAKNAAIYHSMIECLDKLGIEYNDKCYDGLYHSIYLNKCSLTSNIMSDLPNRTLTPEFISSLSQHQAEVVMWSMIEGDGTLGSGKSNITYTCGSKYQADMFQYLAFVAGHATNVYETTPNEHNDTISSNTCYPSVSNKEPIKITKPYFTVTVLRVKRAHIYPHHKSITKLPEVWCPTTNTGTWVARCNGKVFITGNSVIQGSAAEQTKMAMLLLENDPEWAAIGGRLILPVHDELIAEVPIEHYERGGELLSSLMCKAAEFLPFPSKCDVTTMTHWYGLEYPCPYTKPDDLDNLSEDEIKWIQYFLVQSEYILPVYPDENGDKPRGNAAKGVNGVWSEDLSSFIDDYVSKNRISRDEFIDHIEYRVNISAK